MANLLKTAEFSNMGDSFIYGAQYYRAPTPGRECWATDLERMSELGFNSVKFWAQWRWSERSKGVFYWDDLDELMDIADSNGLAVTINLIADVAPSWLFKKYPDAKMVDAAGRIYEPCANICRQIGGYPGPCYLHPEALAARKRFVEEAVSHFSKHPAMSMWDVWNEPENNLHVRTPERATLLCYCDKCLIHFKSWLKHRYGSVEKLNDIWGRCYGSWDEIEAPLQTETISDFIDWREFHLDKLTGEANWRLETAKQLDPAHTRYLHVVSNSMDCFNSVTCVDDFDLAKNCQVFGTSIGGFSPFYCIQAVSAAQGKPVFNAECHVNYGDTAMHQRIVDTPLLLKDLLPQVGVGLLGFLYWQYRAETLGMESPAWGLVRPDGSERPVTRAAEEFGNHMLPLSEALAACKSEPPAIGLWRGVRNELFQFAIGQLKNYGDSLRCCGNLLYRMNLPFRMLSARKLEKGDLENLKILLMPDAYFLDEKDAELIDAWLRAGGVLIADAHLAGYNGTSGRHSRHIPGCGLAESWGVYEAESTSSFHLPLAVSGFDEAKLAESKGDVAKALSASGASGAEFFPIDFIDEAQGTEGSSRFAAIAGTSLKTIASFHGTPCVVAKEIGQGLLLYTGTSLGLAARKNGSLLKRLLLEAIVKAGVCRTSEDEEVHVDVLRSKMGTPEFVILTNSSPKERAVKINIAGGWKGVFRGVSAIDGIFIAPPDSAEIFIPSKSNAPPLATKSKLDR